MTNTELKQIRLSMGLKQSELAKLLHVHEMTISRWERGKARIPGEMGELLGYKWREFGLQYIDGLFKPLTEL